MKNLSSRKREDMLSGSIPPWGPAVLAAFMPLTLYAWYLFSAPVKWPFLWFPTLMCAFIFSSVFSLKKRKRLFISSALFLAGLLSAGVMEVIGVSWLHLVYIPYVLTVGVVFHPSQLFIAALSVPLFEMPHLTGGQRGEELTLLFSTALAAALLHVARRQRKAVVSRLGKRPMSPPVLEGLESEPDPELREILRAVMFTMKPDAVSLFLIEEGELSFRCSTAQGVALSASGIIHDGVRFGHSIVENGLKGPRAGTGYRREGKVSSAVASPVLDGSIILGVLVVDSADTAAFGPDTPGVLEIFAGQVARVLQRQRIYTETEKNVDWLNIIHEESSRLVAALDIDSTIRMVAEGMQRIANVNIYVFIKSGNDYVLNYKNGFVPGREIRFSMKGTLTEMSLQEKEHKYFSNLRDYPLPVLPFDNGPITSAFMLPLLYGEEPLGAIVLTSEEEDSLAPRQVDYIRVLGRQAALSLKNAIYHEQLKQRSVTDGLTGLYNHRHFKEKLGEELKRFDRNQRPFSLLLIDIDFFKKINDTCGHRAGDAVLRGVAATIKETLRDIDVSARYGGEEFAAILIDNGVRGAFQIAERVRHNIRSTDYHAEGNVINLTASIGISSCPDDGETADELVERADRALYHAKAEGRNRTVAFQSLADAV